MEKIKKRIKDFLFLQSLFLYFSIINIFSKKTSACTLFSLEFFKMYLEQSLSAIFILVLLKVILK